jgi:hypothetical protein
MLRTGVMVVTTDTDRATGARSNYLNMNYLGYFPPVGGRLSYV